MSLNHWVLQFSVHIYHTFLLKTKIVTDGCMRFTTLVDSGACKDAKKPSAMGWAFRLLPRPLYAFDHN